MLNINEKVENGKAIIALEGRLDTVTAPDLEPAGSAFCPGRSTSMTRMPVFDFSPVSERGTP